MTRYVIDAGAAIQLARDEIKLAAGDELLAPTLLRSQVLSSLYSAVHRGELNREEAQQLLTRIRLLRIRFLGDRVLQNVAWKLADRLGLAETLDAEYIALTTLQADALVTLNTDLAGQAQVVVTVAPIGELYRTAERRR